MAEQLRNRKVVEKMVNNMKVGYSLGLKIFGIFILVLLQPEPLYAQTIEICGKVYDSKTRNDLPGATVQLMSADSTVIETKSAYSESSLNTNDVVWDARLSCPILKGRIVLMLDGFDILGNLKNVNYDINGQGRTEVRRNMLQQYVMLHARFKLSKQPKKKI